MFFHKSFSKKDILGIAETLDIEIEDAKDYNKQQLTKALDNWITENPESKFLPNVLMLDNVEQLITHFSTINQSKINSAKTRAIVMARAKKLIAYGKNGYLLTEYGYPKLEEIIEDVDLILPFGDSPSVRKAINWINNDPKIKEKFFPVISEITKKKLEEKKKLKEQSQPKWTLTRGHFLITFD
tara:strand:- start:4733 stop:5284 length:552 start_codon:yes stop_codon:yes gene_type:complete